MKRTERRQLVAVGIMLAGWIVMIVDAWPQLVTRLSSLLWVSVVAIHGGALVVAVHVYLESRKQATTSREILNLLSSWLMTWVLDFALFTKLGK
ncbi:MAG: hypothetical protein ABI895_08370 [Deltaproteobacteria bacterium]